MAFAYDSGLADGASSWMPQSGDIDQVQPANFVTDLALEQFGGDPSKMADAFNKLIGSPEARKHLQDNYPDLYGSLDSHGFLKPGFQASSDTINKHPFFQDMTPETGLQAQAAAQDIQKLGLLNATPQQAAKVLQSPSPWDESGVIQSQQIAPQGGPDDVAKETWPAPKLDGPPSQPQYVGSGGTGVPSGIVPQLSGNNASTIASALAGRQLGLRPNEIAGFNEATGAYDPTKDLYRNQGTQVASASPRRGGFINKLFGSTQQPSTNMQVASLGNFVPQAASGNKLDLGRQVYDYYKSQGMPDHQAAAIAGNMAWESGGNPNSVAVGDNYRNSPASPHSYGIGQWNDRLPSLVQYARANGVQVSEGDLKDANYVKNLNIPLQTQLGFAKQEMQGPENRAYQMISNAPDLQSAAQGAISYHRPAGWSWGNPAGGHGFNDRIGIARQILNSPPQDAVNGGSFNPTLAAAGLQKALQPTDGSGPPAWQGPLPPHDPMKIDNAALMDSNVSRGLRTQGKITVPSVGDLPDRQFDFASGSNNANPRQPWGPNNPSGRGSVPFGVFPVGRPQMGTALGDVVPLQQMFDPKTGDQRTGILIHASNAQTIDKVASAGCLAIPSSQWYSNPQAGYVGMRDQLLMYLNSNKNNQLAVIINPDGSANIGPITKFRTAGQQ